MRKFMLLFLMMLVASCVQAPWKTQTAFTCEQIAWLQRQVNTVTPIKTLRDSIHEEFDLPLERIEARSDENDPAIHYVTWTDQRKLTYRATLDAKGQISSIGVDAANTPGDQLLSCLGQPSHYYAYARWEENGPWHRAYLFFPAQGVMAHGSDHWRADNATQPIPAIDGQFPFNELMIVKPQPIEQILTAGWGDYGPRRILQECKPWPGAWEKIEFAYKSSLEQ